MIRINLLRIIYGDDNCDFLIQNMNKDCVNNIAAFLFIGYTLNNESIINIHFIENKTYTFRTFSCILSKLLNEYDTLNSKLSKIKQSEILYRYINMYYSIVASSKTTRFTNICYNKGLILQQECNNYYNDENNKYIHNYNTRKNAQIKRYINEINIARDRFMKEVKNALYLLRELNKKYPMVPPGMWI